MNHLSLLTSCTVSVQHLTREPFRGFTVISRVLQSDGTLLKLEYMIDTLADLFSSRALQEPSHPAPSFRLHPYVTTLQISLLLLII